MDTALKIRKHLTPPRGMGALLGSQELRREIRREVSERVTLTGDAGSYEGWSLNVSRGGVRLIVEREVVLGDEFDVTVGALDASPLTRRGRVVWLQEEADGFIVGVAFIGFHASERQ
jgi:PilZ domain